MERSRCGGLVEDLKVDDPHQHKLGIFRGMLSFQYDEGENMMEERQESFLAEPRGR